MTQKKLPFQFENPRQERIYRRLGLVGPGPAAFYQDICHLIKDPNSLNSNTHIISHLFREIESALRDVLEIYGEGTKPSKKGSDDHAAEIFSILKGLKIPEDSPFAKAWLNLAGKENPEALHKRAHRDSLGSPRAFENSFKDFCDEMETILDFLLEKFEKLFPFSLLDELLKKENPTKDDLKTFKNHVPNNQSTYTYFFERLSFPQWILPLAGIGSFSNPPDPIIEGGYIRFPLWPQSRFLAKMARLAESDISKVILKIPETENERVHEDLADAALCLPPTLAVKWAKRETKWIKKRKFLYLRLSEKLSAVVVFISERGHSDTALGLSKALLSLFPQTKRTRGKFSSPEPRSKLETWDYERFIKKIFPVIIKTENIKAFELFCELLAEAIRLSLKPRQQNFPDDYSYIWRPEIAAAKRNYSNVRDLLVSAVRQAAVKIAEQDPKKVKILLVRLFNYKPSRHIFHRIGLYLLNYFPDAAPQILCQSLIKKQYFDQPWCQREYEELLSKHFSKLSPKKKEIILNWIGKGPKFSPAELKRKPEVLEKWQLSKLSPLQTDLPDKWKQQFDKLVKKYGTPERVPIEYGAVWSGPNSPKTASDLSQLTIVDLIAYLKNWTPPKREFGPSPSMEGLGRVLTDIVVSNPENYAKDADQFQNLDPTYLRSILSGFKQVAMNKGVFSWEKILMLCDWVLQQPREIPGRVTSTFSDRDPDWGWTRKTMAHLLSQGLHEGPSEILFSNRELVWSLIKPLSDDSDPTPKDEADFLASEKDPQGLAINSTRGEAMNAVILYGLWVHRNLKNENKNSSNSFDSMPEVREALEYHLNPKNDSSLAIRSAYGRWFPWLNLLDPEWAKIKKINIFPEDPKLSNFHNAAWKSYVNFCQPYDQVFELLKEEYQRSVDSLRTQKKDDYGKNLSEHLMVLYWRGKIPLHSNLMKTFYEKASPELKAHALWFVGSSLYKTEEKEAKVPDEIICRLKELWDFRLKFLKTQTEGSPEAQEAEFFGWWFVAGKFEENWSLDQLLEALKISKKLDPDHLVIEKLQTLVSSHPLKAIQCLEEIVMRSKDTWITSAWKERIREIISIAMQSGDQQARVKGGDLVNQLGNLGHFEFKNLIPT